MAGERQRFLADALHQAAVSGQRIGEMIDEAVTELGIEDAFGERHADGVGKALAERTRRRLDARRVAVFGMARRP